MMKRSCLLILLLALLTALCSLPAWATVYAEDSLIIDKADMLTDQEETWLTAKMTRFIEKTDCHITFITDTVRYSNDNEPAELDMLVSEDLVLLTVSYVDGQYYYHLFTYGKAYSRISDSEVDTILDADGVYYNLKNGNIYEGLSAFIDKAQPRTMFFAIKLENVAPLAIVSVIVAIVWCAIVIARYKMKLRPTNYPLDKFAKLRLTEERDIFTGKFVTKRRISSSSGSVGRSGGGGGGRSGGGRGGR